MSEKRFNIRVYGIITNERDEVLLTDEFVAGMEFTKFPGGGLELGEGTIDCLKRECIEELNQPIEVTEHFYTTDFYQASAFNSSQQLISIYYRGRLLGEQQFEAVSEPFDFSEKVNGAVVARWVPINQLAPDQLKWPVDKKVATLILDQLVQ